MSDQLMRYYERELAYVRNALSGFSKNYPQQAQQLHLNQSGAEDPNITRLIDGMALLTAKTEQRLDEQLPEVVQDLLSILYPGYTHISPSYCAMELEPDLELLSEAVCLPKGTEIEVAAQADCLFTSCADLDISPFFLKSVEAEAAPFSDGTPNGLSNAEAVIHLELNCCDEETVFSQLNIDHFDFYVRGFEQNSDSLIELLLQQTQLIVVSDLESGSYQTVSPERMYSRVADVGFQFLPKFGNQFVGFDLLRDYFTYPDKAAYFRIKDIGKQFSSVKANKLRLSIYVRHLPAEFLRLFDTSVFSLYVVPALNLFEFKGEPLHYDFSQLSIPIMADSQQDSELDIISVKQVKEVKPDGDSVMRPLYQSSYYNDGQSRQWQSRPRWNISGERQLELSVNCTEQDLDRSAMILALDLMCSNGRGPCLVPRGSEALSQASIDLPGGLKVLSVPSSPLHPPKDDELYWRFIALLNCNFSSLLQTSDPVQALKDVLALCCPHSVCRQVDSIRAVRYEAQVASMNICGKNTFAAGTEVYLTLDLAVLGDQFTVFSDVLNAFYQQFCSFDRFIQLRVEQFGVDHEAKVYPPVHGSQLCL